MLSSTLTHLQKAMQTKIYQLGQLLAVLPSTHLLAATRHQSMLQEIQQLSALPETHFKALYRSAINRFAEFVQLIPEEPQNALGGLLNLGLARATLALRQFASEAGVKLDADPLINYAIFTAGLFFDAARVISQQNIVICDETGKYLQDWYPYSGTMVDQGIEYYKMYPYNSTIYDALNHEAAALFARQMMPQDAFLWLSSDLELFIDWLSALRGDHTQEGRKIGRIFSLIRHEDVLGLMKSLPQIDCEVITPKESQPEDQCLLWLREGIGKGTIGVNTLDAHLQLLDDGTLYLNNDIFKRFLDESKLGGDAAKLASVFNERFGIENIAITQEKAAYANFLMQRGDPRTVQVRNGMLAFGGVFNLDKTRFPVSPLRNDIKAVLHLSRQLPGVKQTISAERQKNSNLTFKMR